MGDNYFPEASLKQFGDDGLEIVNIVKDQSPDLQQNVVSIKQEGKSINDINQFVEALQEQPGHNQEIVALVKSGKLITEVKQFVESIKLIPERDKSTLLQSVLEMA